MPLKVLMVDVDGVLLGRSDGRRWDADMERDLGIRPELIQEHFFKPHWPNVLRGRTPIEPVLAGVLAAHAPGVSVETFMKYWFACDAFRNEALLTDIARLRASGVSVQLATDQEHARAAYLWTHLQLELHFDAMHYAADIGATKVEPQFYSVVTARAGLAPDAIGFIDDGPANIDAARRAGWRGYVWTPGSSLSEALALMSPSEVV